MADLDLDELERLFLKGSPGPWEVSAITPANRFEHIPAYCEVEPSVAGGIDPDDARLIVAARNALPALIDSAREAAALRERVESVLNRAGDFVIPRPGSVHRIVRALRAALDSDQTA